MPNSSALPEEHQQELGECHACGGQLGEDIVVDELMFGTGERFTYAVCETCGTLSLREVPDDLASLYPASYYSMEIHPDDVFASPVVAAGVKVVGASAMFAHAGVAALPGLAARFLPHRQFLNLVAFFRAMSATGMPAGRDCRVLDVGCGSGITVAAAAIAGVRHVVGADPHATARTFARGGEVRAASLSDFAGREEFDVVAFHHSFEHIPEPVSVLDDVRRVLSPGGRVLLRVPTVSSEAYDAYGTSWIQWDPPRHLYLFSRQGMAEVARRAGFRVVRVVDDSNAFQLWGSEIASQSKPLIDPETGAVNPAGAGISALDMVRYEARARRLNAMGRGDQAAWVLEAIPRGE